MKTSILSQNGVSEDLVALVSRLVDMIPWPKRRQAMGDVALSILDGKHRVAEKVLGWSRDTVELGIHEFQSGFECINDQSTRRKPMTEDKYPKLIEDIRKIVEPVSQAEPRLRTTLLYTNITAQAVYNALIEIGWSKETLPTVRTISNILNRQGYRLRTVAKTKVQKKQKTPIQSSKTSGR